MRSRPSPEHQEAVARRLAQLSAELAAVRPAVEPPEPHTHLAGARAAPAPPPPVAEPSGAPPPLVPVPGRHAARRSRRLLEAAVPDTLRGRVGLGPSQVAV